MSHFINKLYKGSSFATLIVELKCLVDEALHQSVYLCIPARPAQEYWHPLQVPGGGQWPQYPRRHDQLLWQICSPARHVSLFFLDFFISISIQLSHPPLKLLLVPEFVFHQGNFSVWWVKELIVINQMFPQSTIINMGHEFKPKVDSNWYSDRTVWHSLCCHTQHLCWSQELTLIIQNDLPPVWSGKQETLCWESMMSYSSIS